ncbi:DUF2849 domain-containing protein [Aestuariispira insulae]|uniref:Uncharacterized protein DUF2849 n=1 Tax=Aestuariispira insulae TaxID=1461337 RepID=A0A3D9HK38_9PROT|nr:DUF2849 domain-containing protein [Aestuariispira insulae]RED49641.1 uncharacterized protein DUF2849 [Aestuariispira insulae]
MSAKIVTAYHLRDGDAVFLREDTSWSKDVAEAAVVETAEAEAALLETGQADVTRNIVLDVYAVDVEIVDGTPKPTKFRELLRCLGPSNRTDLGKQAA